MGSPNRRARTWRLFVALFAASTAGAAAASCSLDLDEALLTPTPDASAPDASVEASVDAGEDDAGVVIPDAGRCTKDEDCAAASGCLTSRCDVPRGACVFQVCRPAACSAGTCNVEARTCGAPSTYTYRASQFKVSGPVGCGGALSRCFAAVYPYVFVGTQSGLVAYAARDPRETVPAEVPVTGLGFVPTQIVASGARLYLLGTPVGVGGEARVPLAWIDVPTDPFASRVEAVTALATVDRPPAGPFTLFGRTEGTSLLVDTAAASSLASSVVAAPLEEPLSLRAVPLAFPAGSGPVATSGGRLVLERTTAGLPIFSLVVGAGTPTPSSAVDTSFDAGAPAADNQVFAQSADGAVVWAYASLTGAPGGAPAPTINGAKAFFVLGSADAGVDSTARVDVETYAAVPAATVVVGPAAMLDATTAMITTAIPANLAQTNVQFIRRTPLGVIENAGGGARRAPITLPVSQLAASGSNGLGYVLAVDPAEPTAPTVHVFDPACAP